MNWISVEDRVPEGTWRDEYLVITENGIYFVAKFWSDKPEGERWRDDGCCEGQTNQEVTHWMPLPSPPVNSASDRLTEEILDKYTSVFKKLAKDE